jgi:hypothetical protein
MMEACRLIPGATRRLRGVGKSGRPSRFGARHDHSVPLLLLCRTEPNFLLLWIAAMSGGAVAFLDGWTLLGITLLLGPVTALLLGVAFPLGAVAASLGGVAALLAGVTLVGIAFLLFGRGLAGRCCGLAGRMDIDRNSVPAGWSRGFAGWCRGHGRWMDSGGGPVPAARDRDAAGRCRAPAPS